MLAIYLIIALVWTSTAVSVQSIAGFAQNVTVNMLVDRG